MTPRPDAAAITGAAVPPARPGAPAAGTKVRAEDLSLGRRLAAFSIVVLGYVFYAWSWNTVDILRPYIADALGVTVEQVSYMYTFQAGGALIGAVINAQLADRFGRRRMLAASMVGYGLILWTGTLVDSRAELFAQRFALGYFMGSMYPIAVGIYPGLFPQRQRGLLAAFLFGFYNVAVALQGVALRFVDPADWRLLLYPGLVAVVLAPLAFVLVHDDRKFIPWGGVDDKPKSAAAVPVVELFRPEHRLRTFLIVAMVGLNFLAYQSLHGLNTSWLKNDLGYSPDLVGQVVTWTFVGAALGGFMWGPLGDRLGRRFNAWGFVAGVALIAVYLAVPMGVAARAALMFAITFAISSSMIWGPWIAEMFPAHLRSTAASMFNWGRIISLTAPFITGPLTHAVGLNWTMALAVPAWGLSALLWLRLPETLKRT